MIQSGISRGNHGKQIQVRSGSFLRDHPPFPLRESPRLPQSRRHPHRQRASWPPAPPPAAAAAPSRLPIPASAAAFAGKTDELGAPLNSYDDITNYNNYYEFSENKEAVAPLSKDFKPRPWSVEVSGLVNKPKTFAIDDLLKMFPQEDRIYRLRCVEAWSMVIPWQGFPLASLLKAVEPTSAAKYVHFVTLDDHTQLPNEGNNLYPWPYQEGLRLDEAMNDLALLVTGLYGAPLPAAGRRPHPPGGAVEVRLQGHQGHQQDRAGGYAARDVLEGHRTQ